MAVMAEKPKDTRPVRRTGKPGRPKRDGRLNNKGTVGNRGGKGQKPWEPLPRPGDTKERAWEDARALVRHMAATGTPVHLMGNMLIPRCGEDVVRKHFEWEIENGRLQADLQVMGVAFRMASDGRHESMTRWWASRRVEGFGDKVDLNLNTPIPVQMIPGDERL